MLPSCSLSSPSLQFSVRQNIFDIVEPTFHDAIPRLHIIVAANSHYVSLTIVVFLGQSSNPLSVPVQLRLLRYINFGSVSVLFPTTASAVNIHT